MRSSLGLPYPSRAEARLQLSRLGYLSDPAVRATLRLYGAESGTPPPSPEAAGEVVLRPGERCVAFRWLGRDWECWLVLAL